ncbi:glycosyltransferase [Blastococcus saxobsidens]|uniref:Glycosyltransferase n=1 Tax=Blastococcus saxobsidens TaxID=138336 RepID=A0A6L9VWL8_9ACTN|nr:glycosyltransferase [Blastococcus saxobsidens]
MEPAVRVFVAPNALYPARQLRPTVSVEPKKTFVWIGRLVDEKNPLLALAAFRRLAARHGDLHLDIVGAGPLRDGLEEAVQSYGLSHMVTFWGHESDPAVLGPLFSQAVASVCSGYVGLNVTQSLGFGCPVIWALDPLNAPEVCTLDQSNGYIYARGDAESLAAAMDSALEDHASRRIDRDEVSARVRNTYSAEAMSAGFLSAVLATERPRSGR